MTITAALEAMTSWWFVLSVIAIIAAVSTGVAWFRRKSPEEVFEEIRRMESDPEFGSRRAPIHKNLLSSHRSGQWYASPLSLTARWQGSEPRYREQTGVLKRGHDGAPAPTSRQREVFLLDGGEWVQTHCEGSEVSDPGEAKPHLVTRTRDSRLPMDLRWNKRGANPVDLPAFDAQGERARQLLLEADQHLRRATALWRWGYRAALAGLLLCLVLVPVGVAADPELAVVVLLGTILLLPGSALLRWARITALRRRGRKLLTEDPQMHRAAAWVNQEVVEQWRAGGHDFWEFAPGLPPSMTWSWRKDPRRPMVLLLGVLGLLSVIFVGITLVLVADWATGAAGFPVAMVITTAVLLTAAAAAGWLSMRPDNDYARFGTLMDRLRHGDGLPAAPRVSPWPAPETGRPILTGNHQDVHERVEELYTQSRPWRHHQHRTPA